MKRIICLTIVLTLCISFCYVAQAAPEDYIGKKMWEFTVTTTDGSKFTLSKALKNYDLVIINFWATWCPPCREEFPYLEAAWEKYKNRIDVISLTVEESDKINKITSFAKEYGINFHVARDEYNLFGKLGGMYIPTTVIVGADRKILAVEVGGKSSVEAFTNWFDKYLPAVRHFSFSTKK